MNLQFPDRLALAVAAKNSRVCVGLDPQPGLLPPDLARDVRPAPTGGWYHGALAEYSTGVGDVIEAAVRFCCGIIEAVAEHAVCVKPQAAFFEALAPDGPAAMWRVMQHAAEQDLLVILDAKRGDISSTAEAYAQACFGGHYQNAPGTAVDAVTVNPYMGSDSVEPFIAEADRVGGGLFVLVKTSNPGSGDFQDLQTERGPVYQAVADMVCGWAQGRVGSCGYSSVGAVVGATYPRQLAELRSRMPQSIFLVPGYGAQGSRAQDVAAAFDADGLGAVVNSSRGIIYAYQQTGGDWRQAAAAAARAMRDDLNSVLT